jgi:hypothetical protein
VTTIRRHQTATYETADPRRGLYSHAYCDQRDAAIARVDSLLKSGMWPLDQLVILARSMHRAAYLAEQRRARPC